MSIKKKICMVVQNPMVKGGISAVVNGYRGSKLEKDFDIIYVESYKDGGKITKLVKGIIGYLHFVKVLIFDRPDIIHIHSSFGPSFYRKLVFIYIASWAKKPIINHIHGAEFEAFYLNACDKKKRIIEKAYGKCTILIALSDEWKEKLKLIVQEKHIAVIENYSIIHDEAVKKRNNRSIKNQVLFLGEIGKRKGCYDIPDVIERVVKKIPDVLFVIAGSGEVDEIRKLLDDKGILKNVLFPGWVRGEQKDKLLRDSDVFFLPSYNEGMPMSILDAMGYGLPIVSTNVGGIPKIVHNGENGYIFTPGDIEGFSNAIIELLKNKDINMKYSYSSHNIVGEDYSLEVHLRLLKKQYDILSKEITV